MLKLLLNKVKFGVHHKIVTDYNKNIKYNKSYTYDDAAFSVFLSAVENLAYTIFIIFGAVSFSLLFQREILPFFQGV